MRRRYTSVNIPEGLTKELDKLAKVEAYRSRAEVVSDAIRRFLDERKDMMKMRHRKISGKKS